MDDYFDRKDKATRWKVRAGSWSDVGVYCDILADDNKYSVNHWSPAPGKLAVESGIVDYRGKTKRANAVNAINGAGAYSRIEADWFQSINTGNFYARYTQNGFYVSGSIR